MDVLKLLEDVKNDKVSLEEAAKELKQLPYEDLGFAKLDHHRQIRSGFGEVVFCSGKSDEHLLKIYVGVAGIHRLFAKLEEIRKANCIIAVAGMEGALGGVLAGLVEVPVIAVPTSIGYGANFGGLSALLTMLNSCSNGITVVNIDNGYGAGYISTQINRLAVKAYKPE